MEEIIVGLVVALAAAFVARALYRKMTGKGRACDTCAKPCDKAGASDQTKSPARE